MDDKNNDISNGNDCYNNDDEDQSSNDHNDKQYRKITIIVIIQ